MNHNGKIVSVRQLAKLAGVSPATVSRVLNKQAPVDANTRQRVQELADRLQYRPNQLAHGILHGKSKLIALVMGNLTNEATARIASIIQNKLYQQGYSCIFYSSDQNIKREIECIQKAVEYRVAGMVIATVNYKASEKHFWKLREHGIPFVLLGPFGENIQAPHFYTDNVGLANDIADYFLSLGHENIYILAGSKPSWENSIPVRVEQALIAKGLPDTGDRLIPTKWDFESGYNATETLLKSGKKVSALFAITDDVAAGAAQAIHNAGLSVPDDISVLGMGNTKIATMITPNLTTVDSGFVEVGENSANVLHEMIEAKHNPSKTIEWQRHHAAPGRIIKRASCAPAKVLS